MSFFSLLASPLVRVRLDDSSDDNGVDVVWYITAFFGLGIYLVIQKYNEMRNRPIRFSYRVPEVRLPSLSPASPMLTHAQQ